MGPLAVLAHILAVLFVLFAAYFLIVLRQRALAEGIRPTRRQKAEAALPLLAIFLAIPVSGVLLDHAAQVLASDHCDYLSPYVGAVSRDLALWMIWATLCLIAAVPILVAWGVDRDLASRVPKLPGLAHKAVFRALTGLWPAEPQKPVESEDERWKRLLQRH
ncbi:MAG TPA: hypothetical protein VJ547_12770 [Candidatus Thermoplasmatota archaeon]|nr:hypothetical protein [Candidatus Thermoplasmatota archaeon]